MSGSSQTPGGVRWNEHKAGLEGVDKARVQKMITELSKGSRFYAREQEKAAQLSARVAEFKRNTDAIRKDESRMARTLRFVDTQLIPTLESSRVCGRVLACLDFDAFFAAIEALDDPKLRGIPHAVGAGDRGVLSTASYEARKFGVRSAMPVYIARKLCPELKIVPVRMQRYKEMSKLVETEVLAKYDPGYRMGSIDEAYLDLTELCENRKVEDIVHDIHEDVRRVTDGLTVSVGVAPNCKVAKIAVDLRKPDGTTIILPNEDEDERVKVVEFMRELKLRKIPGIGRVLESYLQDGLGINNVGEILDNRALIAAALSDRSVPFLIRSALGIGEAFTAAEDEEHVRKGMSRQRSFAPEKNETKLLAMLSDIARILEGDTIKRELLGARTVVLKLKTSDFVPHTRSVTVPDGRMVSKAAEFESYAAELLRNEFPIELRLLGIGLQNLRYKKEAIDTAVDSKRSIKRFLKPTEKSASSNSATDTNGRLATRSLAERTPRRKNNAFIRFKRCAACAAGSPVAEGELPPSHEFEFLCPVCNARCFRELGSLNAHLDKCIAEEQCDGDVRASKKPRFE